MVKRDYLSKFSSVSKFSATCMKSSVEAWNVQRKHMFRLKILGYGYFGARKVSLQYLS